MEHIKSIHDIMTSPANIALTYPTIRARPSPLWPTRRTAPRRLAPTSPPIPR